ncbi:site-specific recombinase XerD [Rhizobium sp. ERR 1071]|uniref:tyrosine-type recombinase/integrase n=1 Tax=Rhizobium sp. ERR 1071 TaxID=2572677 RepID=UPI00119AF192|nr:integrase arm-type DNA-binding domain-containing protein [Rhizobium sp. ERR1071]TWB19497.1 site-specific recombinase XerD [Rhizobium sp. ERR1071]
MLTDVQIRKAKAQEKDYKLTDSGGLVLFVSKAGGKLWRYRYKINGKEKLLSLGQYPEMSLVDARSERDRQKQLLKSGRDPSAVKKIEKISTKSSQADTFEVMAKEWHELQKPQWVERHAKDVLDSLEEDVFPFIGALAMNDITPANVLSVIRLIEARDAKETAARVRQRISAVFVYAISSGKANTDPAAMIQKALAPRRRGKQPAIVKLDAARKMLEDVENTPAHPITKLAHRLLAITAARPGTLATTPWHEFDTLQHNRPIWEIPAARMKLRKEYKDDPDRDHLIPLPWQAVELINTIRLITGKGPFVFPNARHAHKPMSENAMGYMLNRAGYHYRHVPHGWRSTFSTVMNTLYRQDHAIIELMLAHRPENKVKAAYDRAEHLERRIELAQIWADLILKDAPSPKELIGRPRKVLAKAK